MALYPNNQFTPVAGRHPADDPSAEPLILTLDIGSSSTRAVLYDARGHAVPDCASQESSALHITADGAAEDDPDAMTARVVRCIDAVLEQAGVLADRIAAVAVATMATTLIGLDNRGQALTNLRTYADTRAASEATQLRRTLDESAIQDRTGCLLRASYWPAQLTAIRRSEPELWRRVTRWATLGEYLEQHFFGRGRVSISAASWTGLLDRLQLVWDTPLCDALDLKPNQLAPLVDVDAPLSGLREAWAQRWPSLRAVPWFPAIGDGAAANIGSGCVGPDQVSLTVGTTGAMRVVLPDVSTVPPGLWCYRVDRNHALLGGATSEGGNVYAWLRNNLQLDDPDDLETALAAMPPDSHGLTFLPFVAGERSPGWAGNIPATIHGITLATPPRAMVRAGLEAVAYRFALIQQRLGELLPSSASSSVQVIASGGALLNSPTWMQIFADVLGRPLVASTAPETTSRGAAVLALRSLGLITSLAEYTPAQGKTFSPDAANHRIYTAAIARQGELYKRLTTPSPFDP